MFKLIPLILLTTFVSSCSESLPIVDWNQAQDCQLKLVAYKTSKHSKYWMEDEKTKTIFYFHSLGGRRIPTISLGESIKSKCMIYNNQFITQFEQYKTSIVQNPNTGITDIKTLDGYEYLVN